MATVVISPILAIAVDQIAFIPLTLNTSQPEGTFARSEGIAAWNGNGFWVPKLSAYHVADVHVKAVIAD